MEQVGDMLTDQLIVLESGVGWGDSKGAKDGERESWREKEEPEGSKREGARTF